MERKSKFLIIVLLAIATNALAQQSSNELFELYAANKYDGKKMIAAKELSVEMFVNNTDDNAELFALNLAIEAANTGDKYALLMHVDQIKSAHTKEQLINYFFNAGHIQPLFMVLDYDRSFLAEAQKEKYQKSILDAFAKEMFDFNSKTPQRFIANNLIPIDDNGNISELTMLTLWTYQQEMQNELFSDTISEYEYDYDKINTFISVDRKFWPHFNNGNSEYKEALNLLNYALYLRRDPGMVDILVNTYNADLHLNKKKGFKQLFDGDVYKIQDPDTKEIILREGELNFPSREIQIINSLLKNETIKRKLLRQDSQVLSTKLHLLEIITSYTLVCESPADYQLGKETIELLIENGFKTKVHHWVGKYLLTADALIDETWEEKDEKYWLAVFNGNYKKRFR